MADDHFVQDNTAGATGEDSQHLTGEQATPTSPPHSVSPQARIAEPARSLISRHPAGVAAGVGVAGLLIGAIVAAGFIRFLAPLPPPAWDGPPAPGAWSAPAAPGWNDPAPPPRWRPAPAAPWACGPPPPPPHGPAAIPPPPPPPGGPLQPPPPEPPPAATR